MGNWKNWLELAVKLAPIVLGVAGVPTKYAGPISVGLVEAEKLGGSGADKKQTVLSIATSMGATPEEQATIAGAIDTTVHVLNVVHDNHKPVEEEQMQNTDSHVG